MQIRSTVFDTVQTVVHLGVGVTLATRAHDGDGDGEAPYDDVYYSLLVSEEAGTERATKAGSSSEEAASFAWTPFADLEFPDTLAPVGMRLLAWDVAAGGGDASTGARTRPGAGIRACSVGDELFVFRQVRDADDTLYVDRFRLDADRRTLVPVTESRFVRSGVADVPGTEHDALGTRATDGQIFVAATREIVLDGPIDDGFCVSLVPDAEGTGGHWHLFVGRGGAIVGYRIRRSPYADFDLRQTVDGTVQTHDPALPTSREIAAFTSYQGSGESLRAPASLVYAQQEAFVDPDGRSASLMTGVRLLLTAVTADSGSVAVFDLAVTEEGTLAEVDGPVSLADVSFGVSLVFDGRLDAVRTDDTFQTSQCRMEAWIRPSRLPDDPTDCLRSVWSLVDTDGEAVAVVSLDGEGRVVVDGVAAGESPTRWRTYRAVPQDRWTQLAVIVGDDGMVECLVGEDTLPYLESGQPLTLGSKPWTPVLGQGGEDAAAFLGEAQSFRIADPDGEVDQLHWTLDLDHPTQMVNTVDDDAPGSIDGAQWGPGRAGEGGMPIVHRDPAYLDVRAALLPEVTSTEAVVPICGADGRVRLYYRRAQDDHIGVAQLSTEVARAQEVTTWSSEDEVQGAVQGALVLTSRLAGSVSSPPSEFGPLDGDVFSTFTLSSILGDDVSGTRVLTEVWSRVPRDPDAFCAVLNGEALAAQASGDAAVAANHAAVVYDYEALVSVDTGSGAGPVQVDSEGRYASAIAHASAVDLAEDAELKLPEQSDRVVVRVAGEDPWWLADPIQPVASLDSTHDGNVRFIQADATPELSIQGSLTLECWVQRRNRGATGLLSYLDDDRFCWQLGFDVDGRPYIGRGDDADHLYGCVARSPVLDPDWVHLAAVYRTSTGLYLQDGVYVDCGGGRDLAITEALSVEAWVKADAAPDGDHAEQVLVGRWDEAGLDRGWKLALTPEGVTFTVQPAGGDAPISVTAAVDSQDYVDDWCHVAGVYDPGLARKMLAFSPEDENYLPLGAPGSAMLEDCTIEMWVAVDPEGSGERTLIYAPYTNSQGDEVQQFRLYLDDNELKLQFFGGGPIALHGFTPDGTPHHLAVCYSHWGSYVAVCLDGALATTTTPSSYSTPADESTGLPWILGARVTDGEADAFFRGALSQVRIWKGVRTEAQIADGMTRSDLPDDEGLLASFLLARDPGSSPMAFDAVDQTKHVVHARPPSSKDDAGGEVRWVGVPVPPTLQVFMDDTHQAEPDTPPAGGPLRDVQAPLLLGRTSTGGEARPFCGKLDDVRVWRSRRWKSQLQAFERAPLVDPEHDERLAAAWAMDEGHGTTLADIKAGSPGRVCGMHFGPESSEVLWVPTAFGGAWTLYVDGRAVPTEPLEGLEYSRAGGLVVGVANPGTLDPYGVALAFQGLVAEVRIWDRERSATAIAEDRDRPLRGDEAGLAGYWPLREGTGTARIDRSGNANDATLVGSSSASPHVHGTVPFSGEDPRVVDASNGHVQPAAEAIALSAAPSAFDYFADGRLRRAYVYISQSDGGFLALTADRTVGDAEVVYLGQVQYEPQIVGYIEGAPPVPSENLTIDQPSNPDRYVGTATVTLSETVDRGSSSDFTWDLAAGLKGEADAGGFMNVEMTLTTGLAAGAMEGLIGILDAVELAEAGVTLKSLEASFAVELHGRAQIDGGGGRTSETGHGDETSTAATVVLAGGWQNNVYDISGSGSDARHEQANRFYRPNNMGVAVVRSLTADLFAIRSRETRAVLGYVRRVPKGMREDTNLINFRLNPQYVKNGTLDGSLGYDRDLDFPDYTPEASYLRPAEAYRLEANAARQEADDRDPSEQDFANHYVWTADGGLYAKEIGLGAVRKDALHGHLALQGSLGLLGRTRMLVLVAGVRGGLNLALDLGADLTWNRGSEESTRIQLRSQVEGEGFLAKLADTRAWSVEAPSSDTYSAWTDELNDDGTLPPDLARAAGLEPTARASVTPLTEDEGNVFWYYLDVNDRCTIQADPDRFTFAFEPQSEPDPGQYPVLYSHENCPGKVRDYRFSTIYQHPRKANFDRLWSGTTDQPEPVIDPAWLAGSDPDAVALRQARADRKRVWRVLHRVTYVNRVPPESPADGASEPSPPTEDVANRALRPDDYSMVANAGVLATCLFGLEPGTPDLVRMSANVDTLLAAEGIGAAGPQRQAVHDRVMTWLEAVLASGTLAAPGSS